MRPARSLVRQGGLAGNDETRRAASLAGKRGTHQHSGRDSAQPESLLKEIRGRTQGHAAGQTPWTDAICCGFLYSSSDLAGSPR
jgi:hypothetical protein